MFTNELNNYSQHLDISDWNYICYLGFFFLSLKDVFLWCDAKVAWNYFCGMGVIVLKYDDFHHCFFHEIYFLIDSSIPESFSVKHFKLLIPTEMLAE